MRIDYLRGYPFEKLKTTLSREALVQSGFATPSLQFVRGKPLRAQGTLGHYVVFAEMLMQLGCLAWAILLGSQPGNRWWSVSLAIIFVALSAALVATETRASLGGLALGCFVALLILTGKRVRVAATAALLVLMACGALWIHHTRGLNWSSSNDTGTQFRVLMWEDGLRLVRQHPWFGVGMETVRYHWLEWNIRGFIRYRVQSHFHSTPLQIAVERGLTTLAAWLWFVVAYLTFLVRLIAKTRTRSCFATSAVTAVLAGFIAFLTTSFAHYNLGEEPLVTSLFFFFGVAVGIDHLLSIQEALDVA
jgi:O-antigen ligase